MKSNFLIFCLLFSVSLSAQTLDGYHKRFKILKNEDGSVKAVTMKLMTKGFNIRPYIEQIKNDVLDEVDRLRNSGFRDAELDAFESELEMGYLPAANGFTQDPDAPRVTRRAIENLQNIDIRNALLQIDRAGVFEKLQEKIKEALFLMRLDVISTLDDPKYFFKRNVSYEVVKQVLKFAEKRLGDVPLLNLASFMIVRVHELVLEQRVYHQNMLMHYLSQFSEKELGMTHEEVNRVYSSIFESRLSPLNYFEYKEIAKKWNHFGTDKFFMDVRRANTAARKFNKNVSTKVSWGFMEVKDERHVIYHLLNNRHMLTFKPALAYDYNKPKKVRRFRALLNLAQVGLGFLPINGTIKGIVENFVESFYVEQKRAEGALAAYFESRGNTEMAKAFYAQTINPYLIYR